MGRLSTSTATVITAPAVTEEEEEGAVGFSPVDRVPAAVVLAHKDVAAGGDAHDDLGEDLHHLAGVVDGRNASLADEPTGHNQVGDGVGRLEQGRENHRPSVN